ncbi:emopamil-binding protein-like [Anaeramoeba ignava]|uniref:Emopamil-binding protein-like n=1 Tax=Anaeramoeba ignava TaxID=1746090 RepID=A0A9Q0LAI7_ANAIG|nr:emopamil-binding protein-like [Anaeramoeba ignava]
MNQPLLNNDNDTNSNGKSESESESEDENQLVVYENLLPKPEVHIVPKKNRNQEKSGRFPITETYWEIIFSLNQIGKETNGKKCSSFSCKKISKTFAILMKSLEFWIFLIISLLSILGMTLPSLIIGKKNQNSDSKYDCWIWIKIFNIFWILLLFFQIIIFSISRNLKIKFWINFIRIVNSLIILFLTSWSIYGLVISIDNFDNSNSTSSTISSIIFIESFIFIIISSLFIIWLIYESFFKEGDLKYKMKILLIGIITTIIIGFGMAIPCLIIGTKSRNYSNWKIDFIWILIFNIFWIITTFITSLSLILNGFKNFFKNLDIPKNQKIMITFTLIPIIFLLSWSIYGLVISVDNFQNSNSTSSTISSIIFIESFIFIIISSLFIIWLIYESFFKEGDLKDKMKILLITIITTIIIGFVMAIPCLIIGTKNRNYSNWKTDFIWILIFNIFWIITIFITSLSLILHDFKNFFKNLDESKNRVIITFTLIPIIFLLSWSIYGLVISVDNFDNSNSMHSTISSIIFSESFIFIIISSLFIIWLIYESFLEEEEDFKDKMKILLITIITTIIIGFVMTIPCLIIGTKNRKYSDWKIDFIWILIFNIFWIIITFITSLSLILHDFKNFFKNLDESKNRVIITFTLIPIIFLLSWSIYGLVISVDNFDNSNSTSSTISSIIFIESFIFIIISSLFIIWLIYESFLEKEGFKDKMEILLSGIIITIIIGFGIVIPCLIIGTKNRKYSDWKTDFIWILIFNIFWIIITFITSLYLILHGFKNFFKNLDESKNQIIITFTLIPIIFLLSWSIYGLVISIDNFDNSNSMHSTISKIIFIESFIFIIISSLFIIWLIYESFLEEEGFKDKMKILLSGIIITIIIGFGIAIPCLIIGTKNRNYSNWKTDFIWILIFNIFWIIITFITSLYLILRDFEDFFRDLDESKNRVMITFTLIPIIFPFKLVNIWISYFY